MDPFHTPNGHPVRNHRDLDPAQAEEAKASAAR